MPLHLRLDAAGRICGAGPTLAKLCAGRPMIGRPFAELFELRSPRRVARLDELAGSARLRIGIRHLPGTVLRGLAVPLDAAEGDAQDDDNGGTGGLLLNLSFGISVVEAVRDHGLTEADFAPTDLTVEMLYLVEAKSAVLDELRDMNGRLLGAKAVAEEQARTDTLTGLRNRRAVDHALRAAVAEGRAFGLVHLDLDHFKQVNDTMGHAAGDHVLREVARILADETRSGDVIGRVGGDEFVILFPGVDGYAPLISIARRILARLEAPIPFEGRACRVSASIGATLSCLYAWPTPERLLGDADRALYASKRSGRGRVTTLAPADAPEAALRPEVMEGA
ncbi:GGDEF domain-containing protein [Rhodobacteraceae bacterium WD3A24]|nr:GGDEF domain-containing protein [Rhodobacteraceae bacterium WD3A24]